MKTFKKKLLKNKKHNSYKKNIVGGSSRTNENDRVLMSLSYNGLKTNLKEHEKHIAMGALVGSIIGIAVANNQQNNRRVEHEVNLIIDIERNPYKFKHLNYKLKRNEELVEKLLIANPEVFEYIPKTLKQNTTFLTKVSKNSKIDKRLQDKIKEELNKK